MQPDIRSIGHDMMPSQLLQLTSLLRFFCCRFQNETEPISKSIEQFMVTSNRPVRAMEAGKAPRIQRRGQTGRKPGMGRTARFQK